MFMTLEMRTSANDSGRPLYTWTQWMWLVAIFCFSPAHNSFFKDFFHVLVSLFFAERINGTWRTKQNKTENRSRQANVTACAAKATRFTALTSPNIQIRPQNKHVSKKWWRKSIWPTCYQQYKYGSVNSKDAQLWYCRQVCSWTISVL